MKIRKFLRNLTLKWRIESRYILEKKIFPNIKNKRILWVGCASYTKDYVDIMLKNRNEVYTIDILPEMKKYGAKKHFVENIINADKIFQKNFFDIVFMTGVIGYGLNKEKDAEITMEIIYNVLKPQGILILWWADYEPRNKIKPARLKNSAKFMRINFGRYPFGYRTKQNTIIEFYRK